MTLDLRDILKLFGFDPTLRTKFVRHQDDRYPVREFLHWLELYQSYQSKPRFHDVVQIVSFYGLPWTRACFYGFYRVLGHRPAGDGPTPEMCPSSGQWQSECRYFYDLNLDPRFNELRSRLIIDWGKGTRSWVQKPSNKPVLEILAPGRRLPPFDDYLEFSLTYHELRELFETEEAHRDWRAALSAVAGIYLILAEDSGDLYVGSAYGVGGIWGRWRDYATSGDGGNARLRHLIRRAPGYPGRFRFSVLQILPKSMAKDEILRHEARYKEKLGTRAAGLNAN